MISSRRQHAPPDVVKSVTEVFRAELKACTVTSHCNREFVRIERLRRWLRTADGGKSPIQDILSQIDGYGWDWEPILEQDDKARVDMVLSILMLIGHQSYVKSFHRVDIRDHRLPIAMEGLQKDLREIKELSPAERDKIAAAFHTTQYKFCSPKLSIEARDWTPYHIVPLQDKQALESIDGREQQKGATSRLYSFTVLEEFLSERLKAEIPHSKLHIDNDECYEIVRKSFTGAHRTDYLNEVDMFKAIQHCYRPYPSNIVRYLGNGRHRLSNYSNDGESSEPLTDDTKTYKYHILLEKGDFDLDACFRDPPPYLHAGIELLWDQLFGVADGLVFLHELKDRYEEEYYGVHADIKPANIIKVGLKFKLADLGFSRYNSEKWHGKLKVEGFTLTWGAPELHRGRQLSKSSEKAIQSIDIWSLGCVFSMAATWIVFGPAGIAAYRRWRKSGVQKALNGGAKSKGELDGPGDYFHNGVALLPEVKEWHNLLRNTLRITDKTTGPLLDLVETHMLLENPEHRISARELSQKCRNIIDKSRQEPAVNDIPPGILDSFNPRPDEIFGRSSQIPGTDPSIQLTVKNGLRPNDALKILKLHQQRQSYLITSHGRTTSEPEQRTLIKITTTSSDTPLREVTTVDQPGQNSRRVASVPKELGDEGDAYVSEDIYEDTVTHQERRLSNPRPGKHPLYPFDAWLKSIIQPQIEPDEYLEDRYYRRDLVFLVDNGDSMRTLYSQLIFLLLLLLRKCNNVDDNGLDLAFTCSRKPPLVGKSYEDIRKEVLKETYKPEGGETDMYDILKRRFDQYLEMWEKYDDQWDEYNSQSKWTLRKKKKSPEEPRNVTLLVLTDGVWKGSAHDEVSDLIKDFCTKLRNRFSNIEAREKFSIAFVQFGNDPQGTEVLTYLDDGLKRDGFPDIIDTTASTKDLYKMLTGSFDANVDALDDAKDTNDDTTTSGHARSRSVKLTPTTSNLSASSGPSPHAVSSPTRERSGTRGKGQNPRNSMIDPLSPLKTTGFAPTNDSIYRSPAAIDSRRSSFMESSATPLPPMPTFTHTSSDQGATAAQPGPSNLTRNDSRKGKQRQ